MAIGAKRNETRGCRTTHRGDIAIHAAKTDHGTLGSPRAVATIKPYRDRDLVPSPDTLGCIVAVVDLYDVQPAEFGTIKTSDRDSSSHRGGTPVRQLQRPAAA